MNLKRLINIKKRINILIVRSQKRLSYQITGKKILEKVFPNGEAIFGMLDVMVVIL